MTERRPRRPIRVATATFFCALTFYVFGTHLLPWLVARLPLALPLLLVLLVALLGTAWATFDVIRDRAGDFGAP
jgi:hypothetical protein